MPLTDTTVRNTKPREKPFKLFDEKGLFLQVTPNGSKRWRLKYRFDGKEKLLSCGVYPDTTLAKAREKRDAARKLLADGVDPAENRKAVKASRLAKTTNSFEVIAREWHAKYMPNWTPSHGERLLKRLEKDIFPWLGDMPIVDITASVLLKAVRRIEERGALETAHRVQQNCSQIFRYGIATGRCERDPVPDLKGALPATKAKHLAAFLKLGDFEDKKDQLSEEIKSYTKDLYEKSWDQLVELFRDENSKQSLERTIASIIDDKHLFFNQPNAKADYLHYC